MAKPRLIVPMFQQDGKTLAEQSLEYPLTELESGNYVLTGCWEVLRLKNDLVDWTEKYHQYDLPTLYGDFLDKHKKLLDYCNDDEQLKLVELQKPEESSTKKYPNGDQLFVGCDDGSVFEYSLNQKKVVHDFKKIFNTEITSITTTIDNKALLVCGADGGFKEFEIPT